jgi:hypothetical protein
MNFAMLWGDGLLIALLWVLAAAAFVGRIKRRWVRGLLVLVVLGVPLFFLTVFVFASAMMKFDEKIEPDWFGYTLSLIVAYLVGASLVMYRSRRRAPGLAPAAASWPRAPLVFALVIAVAVGYTVLMNMDLVIRARCAIQGVEVQSQYLASLPAITSDSQNAAPLYEKAFAQLSAAQAEEAAVNNTPTGNSLDFDPNEPATIAFLSHQSATLALLRRAAALPACRFDEDLLSPHIDAASMSNLNAERNAANVLNLDAREEIARGHTAAAIADTDAIFGMSRHFGCRPLLISSLVAMGIDAMGDKTLELVLPAVKNRDELAGLHMDQRPFLGRMYQQAMRGEERYGLAIYSNMPPGQDAVPKINEMADAHVLATNAGSVGALFRVFLLDPDSYIVLMENIQRLSTQPYYQVRQQLRDVCSTQGNLLTSILLPSLSRSFETCARVEADDACADVGVAMTRYRFDHGKLPTRLGELVPEYLEAVPLDPFDGQPLRLVMKENRAVIYSVGPSMKDDGGAERTDGRSMETFTLKVLP